MSDSTKKSSHDLPATDGSFSLRFSLRSLLMGTMVICILLGIVVQSVQHWRHAYEQSECNKRLDLIAFSLRAYYDNYRRLPPAITYAADGRAMHSWRMLMLPFMFGANLAYNFQEPWNGPGNSSLQSVRWPEYVCPSARARRTGCARTT